MISKNLKIISEAQNLMQQLSVFRLKIVDGGVYLVGCEDQVKLLNEDLAAGVPFFTGHISPKKLCTLALAIKQEAQNAHISQDDIDFLNNFFEFDKPITYGDVQEYNRKYI